MIRLNIHAYAHGRAPHAYTYTHTHTHVRYAHRYERIGADNNNLKKMLTPNKDFYNVVTNRNYYHRSGGQTI